MGGVTTNNSNNNNNHQHRKEDGERNALGVSAEDGMQQQQQQQQQRNNVVMDLLMDVMVSHLLPPSVKATRSLVLPTVMTQLKQRVLPKRFHSFCDRFQNILLSHDYADVALLKEHCQQLYWDIMAVGTCLESRQLVLESIGCFLNGLDGRQQQQKSMELGVWMCRVADVGSSASAKQLYHDLWHTSCLLRQWCCHDSQKHLWIQLTTQFLLLLKHEHDHVVKKHRSTRQRKQRQSYIAKTYHTPTILSSCPSIPEAVASTLGGDDPPPPPSTLYHPPPEETEDGGMLVPPSNVFVTNNNSSSPTSVKSHKSITDLESLVDSLSHYSHYTHDVSYLKETVHDRASIVEELHQQIQQHKSSSSSLLQNPIPHTTTTTSSCSPPPPPPPMDDTDLTYSNNNNPPPVMIDFFKTVQQELKNQQPSTTKIRKKQNTFSTTPTPPIDNTTTTTTTTAIMTIMTRIYQQLKPKYRYVLLIYLLCILFIIVFMFGLACYGMYAFFYLRTTTPIQVQPPTTEIVLRLLQQHNKDEQVIIIPTTSPIEYPLDL